MEPWKIDALLLPEEKELHGDDGIFKISIKSCFASTATPS